MLDETGQAAFPRLNRAYNSVFRPGRMSIGLVIPLEAYPHGAVPDMAGHIERARLADSLGLHGLAPSSKV